jgi:hypothetical protein
MLVGRWVAVAGLLGVVATVAGPSAGAAESAVTQGGLVLPVGGQGTLFSAVDAVSSTDVWAVGQVNASAVAEHWDGQEWTSTPLPIPADDIAILTDVSASEANDVWASGIDDSAQSPDISLHWDGTSWTQVPVPNVKNAGFTTVLALSPNDVWMASAFSSAREAVVLHWDGTAWRVVKSPQVRFVSYTDIAGDGPDDVWFVGVLGQEQGTVAEHWDGTSISLVKSANPDRVANQLYGVAVTTGGDTWAVGSYGGGDTDGASGHLKAPHSLTEHLEGGRLKWFQPAPRPKKRAWLFGVSALNSTDIWAVGYQGPDTRIRGLIGHWDGKAWSAVDDGGVGDARQVQLLGVSALSANDVWAVGEIAHSSTSPLHLLTLHWDGTSWSRIPV